MVRRDDYTWENAINELALSTHLTVIQAYDLVHPLRNMGIHPIEMPNYLRPIIATVGHDTPMALLGQNLADLIREAGNHS